MPLAKNVAAELRKLADSLDKEPETEINAPYIWFSCNYMGDKGKPLFLALGRLMPRPLVKEYKGDEFRLKYSNDSISVAAVIERNKVCRIVQPAQEAVYECEPLLSMEEESAIAQD